MSKFKGIKIITGQMSVENENNNHIEPFVPNTDPKEIEDKYLCDKNGYLILDKNGFALEV